MSDIIANLLDSLLLIEINIFELINRVKDNCRQVELLSRGLTASHVFRKQNMIILLLDIILSTQLIIDI